LESAVECLSSANPFASFGDLPFGQENQYSFGLQLTQNLFTGGRLSGQTRAAKANRRASRIGLTAAEAQLTLDVTLAYFDALLADRLLEIAEASLRQADSTFEQTRLAEQVGTLAEFDRLRAEVARDNQRPVVIQRRAERDIAYLRLKQSMDLPADRAVVLTSSLNDSTAAPVPGVPMILEVTDLAVDRRAPVLQAAAGVEAQEGFLKAARAQHFPTLALTSSFVQFAYPSSGFPGADDFLTDWTVGLSLQLPLFTGGRISGDVQVARANLEEARQRLRQTRKFAELDAFSTDTRLESARATWEASTGTVQQARRAYEIAGIRFREGISTQLEFNDARLQLQQSEANRAQAVRDLQLARVRAALLPNLPLAGTAGTAPAMQPSAMTTSPAQEGNRVPGVSPTGLTAP
ncbi:MAG: TolC family protein, partial [Gemmatimonadales bacterium]